MMQHLNFSVLLLLALATQVVGLGGRPAPVQAAPAPMRLPVLQRVGVLPVQPADSAEWPADLAQALTVLKQEFPQVVRATRRFQALDDELVKGLWQTPAMRQELKDDYELAAFLHLQISPRSDTVLLTLHLLGPQLEPYLQEEKIIPRLNFGVGTAAELKGWCGQLVGGLVNRIPVDVSVTSVQGSYLTLSGGSEQGLHQGAKLDLVRAWITALHPVLNTWRSFQTALLGEATVIEVREQVSIAKVDRLVRRNDIAVGDGSKVSEIASRLAFARPEASLVPAAANDTIIIEPLYQGEAPLHGDHSREGLLRQPLAVAPKAAPPPARPAPSEESSPHEPLADAKELAPTEEAPGPNKELNGEVEEGGEPATAAESALWFQDKSWQGLLAGFADTTEVDIAQRGWSFHGPGATGSRVAWYLPVTYAGLQVGRERPQQFSYKLGAALGMGKTQGYGSYVGYDLQGRLYWRGEASFLPGVIQGWHLGGEAAINGLGVNSESFGGFDMLRAGAYGLILGEVPAGVLPGSYEWFGELHLTPLTFGRLGYGGSRHSLRSALGWKVIAAAMQKGPRDAIRWGLSLDYGSQLLLDSGSASPSLTTYGLALLARWHY